MKLYYPYNKKFTVGQGFSLNLVSYYAEQGLTGHTGYDMGTFHGDTIFCTVDSYCYLIGNKDNKDPMKYRAVYTVVDDEGGGVSYEISYGHLGDIFAEVGPLKIGDKIGTQSNTGDVAQGGIGKITKEMKLAGSTAGSHLHFQVRLLKKVDKKETGKKYMFPSKVNGAYYEIPYYNNGLRGCIDPKPLFNGKYQGDIFDTIGGYLAPQITLTLRYGSRGDQVKLLQKKLHIPVDGIFGKGTEKNVMDYQKAKGLKADGIVGKLTREKLNE